MRVVRRHLRRGVATWLLCHALAFSAVVPRDCCAAHAHRDGGPPACHETVPAADACRLTGSCTSPAAALSAVLLQGATLASPIVAAPVTPTSVEAVPVPAEHWIRQFLPPDPPPPRT